MTNSEGGGGDGNWGDGCGGDGGGDGCGSPSHHHFPKRKPSDHAIFQMGFSLTRARSP